MYDVKVDKDKSVGCGECVEICPVSRHSKFVLTKGIPQISIYHLVNPARYKGNNANIARLDEIGEGIGYAAANQGADPQFFQGCGPGKRREAIKRHQVFFGNCMVINTRNEQRPCVIEKGCGDRKYKSMVCLNSWLLSKKISQHNCYLSQPLHGYK